MDERTRFILGNSILGVGFLMLWNFNTLWEQMGSAAMVLWVAVVASGAYLILKKP